MEKREKRPESDRRDVRGSRSVSWSSGLRIRGSVSETSRSIAKGGMRFVILDMLNEKPRHGYDIIRAMEEASGGLYSPSPGTIYPNLQALEDQDLVSVSMKEGKKVYSVTDAGADFLEKNKDKADSHRAHWEAQWGRGADGLNRESLNVIHDSFNRIGRAIRDGASDAAKIDDISEVLKETASKVEEIAQR